MRNLDDISIGDMTRGLARYRPFIAAVLAVVLVAVVLPGKDDGTAGGGFDSDEVATGGSDTGGGDGAATSGGQAAAGDQSATGDTLNLSSTGGSSGGGGGGTGGQGAGSGGGAITSDEPLTPPEGAVSPSCDPATGRIKVPSRFAPPCVPPFDGDNGGDTYAGVTANELRLVYYQPQSNAATDAALTAAGANNTPPEQEATTRDWVDLLGSHFETYGRTPKLFVVSGSGASDDDAAAKADAIKIATDIKPIVVWGSNNNAFISELAARQIVCVCSVSQPQEKYEEWGGYAGYTTLMSSTQGYIQRAEYLGKRLARRPAKWAGTSDGVPLNIKERSFALLYFETADKAYQSGAVFFDKHLQEVYNVKLLHSIAYTGPPNLDQTQQQARPFIQRLKDSGVTTVVFAGDPISPAIFTQEATRQRYFPEWMITGSALVDTTIFARTYDPLQWDKGFGVSFLASRVPKEQATAWRLHLWHHGREPTANNQYAVLLASPWAVFTGIHMAGENLTPQSFQKGLFSYPPTGRGMVTSPISSWGSHGIWPFTDYTQYDDVTEIWWDPNAIGEDEVGNQGKGMYRYVDGGKRYLPGEHPKSEPKAFDPEGTVTVYSETPPSDTPPEYEHEPHE